MKDKITLEEITKPGNDLLEFFCSNTWEFHSTPKQTPESIKKSIEGNFFSSEFVKSFFIKDEKEIVGFIRLFDLEDSTPLFDIRVKNDCRGKGVGETALRKLLEYVFYNHKNVTRIEGYTREDNIAMISVFKKCGFVKEAHHRKSWEQDSGEVYDSVGYCILKEDWETGKTTPVNW